MAQFDSLIIFSLIWCLLITLTSHYSVLLNAVLPNLLGIKKFREKKLNFLLVYKLLNLNNSYKII